MPLTTRQRQYLKGLGHPLEPTLRIGRAEITAAVINEAERTMAAHELIKVRIDAEEGATRKTLAADLAAKTGAELVTTIGKVAILFRPFSDKPKIKLP